MSTKENDQDKIQTFRSDYKLGPGSEKETKIITLMKDLYSLQKGEVFGTVLHTSLSCRSIRIGSYKTLHKERVHFTKKAIYMTVPHLTKPKNLITLVIPTKDLLKMEVLFCGMPLIFISTKKNTCERVRKDLNLNFKSQGLYYDPFIIQNDDTIKKITMLPEKLTDEAKDLLKLFYGKYITELSNKEANELLVNSTPRTSTMQAQQALQV